MTHFYAPERSLSNSFFEGIDMPGRGFTPALVLSGGSARGLVHLGVLEEIERRQMKFGLIVGSSMGAIVGGLYAYYRDAETVTARLRSLFGSESFLKVASNIVDDSASQLSVDGFFNRFMWLFRKGVYYTHSMLKTELVSEDAYRQIIGRLVPDTRIEDLPIPFAAVAMDLTTGEEIVITKGSLRDAVAASSAIPGLFPAVEMNGRVLIDGGWVDNVPVAPAIALGAHFVLAVDTTLEVPGLVMYPQSALEIVFRCNELTRIWLTRQRKSRADVLITPEIGKLFWADYTGLEKCVLAGQKAFVDNVGTIYRRLALRRLLTLRGALHPARRGQWRHPFSIV